MVYYIITSNLSTLFSYILNCVCIFCWLFSCSLMDTTADIVQQLTMRAAGGGSGAGSAVLLQSQDDVSRVQALLQLQSDRWELNLIIRIARV